MIEISYEINGKKINPRNIGNAIEASVLSQVGESIKKSIGSIRCSEHHQAPKVKVKGKSLDSLSFEVSGCCDALIDKVTAKIK